MRKKVELMKHLIHHAYTRKPKQLGIFTREKCGFACAILFFSLALCLFGSSFETPATPPVIIEEDKPVAATPKARKSVFRYTVLEPSKEASTLIPAQGSEPDFDKVIPLILSIEGGLSHDPDDEGGVTNYGIAQASHPNINVRGLTRDKAIEIYRRNYWIASHAYMQPTQELAIMHFDASINHGIGTAVRMLKQANGSYARYREIRLAYYNHLASVKPRQRKYLRGWRNRIAMLDRYVASLL